MTVSSGRLRRSLQPRNRPPLYASRSVSQWKATITRTRLIFDLKVEGRDLRMGFMDVRADGAEKDVVVLFHGKNFFGAYWQETIAVLTRPAIA